MRLILLGSVVATWIFHCMFFPIEIEEPIAMEQLTIPIVNEEVLPVQEEPTPMPEVIVEEEPVQEEIVKEESEEVLPTNKWGIELTEDEIDMLAKIAFLEAHTQPDEGILAVIEVVFNRIISDDFPDTLEGVLSQSKPCVQFTTWKNLDIAEPTEKEYDMIYAALNGEKEVLTTEYLFFSRGKQNNNDPIKIEDHWFCKGYQ